MAGLHFVLILLCAYFSWSVSATGISLKVIRGNNDFVEDKQTIFSCHVFKAARDDEVTWSIRDPSTNEKVFFSYSLLTESPPMKLNVENKANFSLWMRRDFSNNQVVCQLKRGNQMASLKLPEIRKTIPIDRVEFLSSDLIQGQPLLFLCDVRTDPAVVKLVDFRTTKGMVLANGKKRKGPNHMLYELNVPKIKVDAEEFDGSWIQCIASKVGFKKPTGNVVSPSRKITVHFFKPRGPSSAEQNVTYGSVFSTNLTVSSNPKPTPHQFSVSRASKSSTHGNVPISTSITISPGKYEYRVLIEFKPQFADSYHFHFETKFLKKRRLMTINVIDSRKDLFGEPTWTAIFGLLCALTLMISVIGITTTCILKKKKQLQLNKYLRHDGAEIVLNEKNKQIATPSSLLFVEQNNRDQK